MKKASGAVLSLTELIKWPAQTTSKSRSKRDSHRASSKIVGPFLVFCASDGWASRREVTQTRSLRKGRAYSDEPGRRWAGWDLSGTLCLWLRTASDREY